MTSNGPICERIARVIQDEVLPALQMDGVGIEVAGFDHGVLQVRLSGACGSCPSTTHAIILGIEHELRQRVPEVDYLEAVV